MFRFVPSTALLAAAVSLLPAAAAQAQDANAASAVSRARIDPSDATAPTPPVNYYSAFTGYRPNIEQPVGSWRDMNNNVGRIGGWRTYAKEARAPEPAAPAGAASSSAPVVVDGKRGHDKH